MGSLSTRAGSLESQSSGKVAGGLGLLAAAILLAGGARPLSTGHASADAVEAVSLCQPEETVLAACPVASKLVSVCGRDRAAKYRFGTTGRIELEASHLRLASAMFAGGGETQISVKRGAYRYVLYDRTISKGVDRDGHRPKVQSSGLMVWKKGRMLSDTACGATDRAFIDSFLAPNYLREGEFVRHFPK